MGVYAGPDLKEDGLVLALDGANLKSFKGEVTTNIVPDAGTMSSWSSYSNGNDGTFTTEFGTTGYKMINRGSWNGIYKGITLPSAGTYTISAWFRYWGGASDNNGATVYTSGGGISDTAVALNKSLIGVWQRVSMTRTYSTTGITFYIISYGGTYGGSNSTWDVTMPQIEQKSYVTNFVDGTRGSTVATGGGWADLSGRANHGELVNGVRESSDNLGALVFDGTDDRVIIPTISLGNGNLPWTCTAWVKTSTSVNSLGTGSVLSNSSGGPVYSMMGVNNGKIVYWTYQNSAWAQKLGIGKTINDNNWHFLSWVNYSNYTMDMYVDGSLDSNVANSTSGNNNPINIIGASWAAAFSANIAQVQIYNRALTASEIRQNFNANRARFGV
jgi:hypothetical protein